MILNRLGNKSAIAVEIQKYFPKHSMYMEMFFGAGGMFFNKPKATHNFVNDRDDDVYNLFRQLVDNKEELTRWIELTPVTERQFKEWAKGKREDTDMLNAVRFLFISNYGQFGKPNTLRIGAVNPKGVILKHMDWTFAFIRDVYFFNIDFREFYTKITHKEVKEKCFTYADPPYLGTDDNYSHSFTEEDSNALFDTLQGGGVRWAMSEFDHPFIIDQATARGLNIHYIGERQNLKNRRTEILVTNYIVPQYSLFN